MATRRRKTDPRGATEWSRPAESFWGKVERTGPDECWPWKGARMASGYGRVWTGTHAGFAHRAAFELGHGQSPGEAMVCHRCDNPPCCNPAHLFLGTRGDNNRDARDKGIGRARFGVANHAAKLTDEEVSAIRRRAVTEPQVALAREFGVSKAQVSRIVSGKRRGPHP